MPPADDDLPWPVIHLDVDADDFSVPATPGAGMMLIFWHRSRPVGQWIITPDQPAPDAASVSARAAALRAAAPALPSGLAPPLPRLSVIIPTRDRADDLARCLRAFLAQTMPPDEIIVVDNASTTTATRDVVASIGNARYVHEPRPGLDFARNAGVRAAGCELIAFCDDDVEIHPEWCERMRQAFDAPEIWAVTGLVLPLELATPAQRMFEFDWGFGRGYERIDFGPAFFAATKDKGCPAWDVGAGASMAFRRTVFERYGVFDIRLGAGASGCGDDSEMWYRVLAEGGTCRYEPSVVSSHRHRRTMAELQRQIRAYMRGHVTALLIQHQRYGHWGNLRRAFLIMPPNYARRTLRQLLGFGRPRDVMLRDIVLGFLDGFSYFWRHRAPTSVDFSVHGEVADNAG